jgi:hypothetical protein
MVYRHQGRAREEIKQDKVYLPRLWTECMGEAGRLAHLWGGECYDEGDGDICFMLSEQ